MEAVVLPVEEERTRPVDPVGGMKGSKGSKCFDGEFPITPNKGRTNNTVNVICRIAVSAVSFNPFVLLLKGFLQLLGSVAEWGPVFNVSLELYLTALSRHTLARYNIIHLTNWAFNRTDGVPVFQRGKNCKGRFT